MNHYHQSPQRTPTQSLTCSTGRTWRESCAHSLVKHILDKVNDPAGLLEIPHREVALLTPEAGVRKIGTVAGQMLQKLNSGIDHLGPQLTGQAALLVCMASVALVAQHTRSLSSSLPILLSLLDQVGPLDPRFPRPRQVIGEIARELQQ